MNPGVFGMFCRPLSSSRVGAGLSREQIEEVSRKVNREFAIVVRTFFAGIVTTIALVVLLWLFLP